MPCAWVQGYNKYEQNDWNSRFILSNTYNRLPITQTSFPDRQSVVFIKRLIWFKTIQFWNGFNNIFKNKIHRSCVPWTKVIHSSIFWLWIQNLYFHSNKNRVNDVKYFKFYRLSVWIECLNIHWILFSVDGIKNDNPLVGSILWIVSKTVCSNWKFYHLICDLWYKRYNSYIFWILFFILHFFTWNID